MSNLVLKFNLATINSHLMQREHTSPLLYLCRCPPILEQAKAMIWLQLQKSALLCMDTDLPDNITVSRVLFPVLSSFVELSTSPFTLFPFFAFGLEVVPVVPFPAPHDVFPGPIVPYTRSPRILWRARFWYLGSATSEVMCVVHAMSSGPLGHRLWVLLVGLDTCLGL